MRILGLTLLLCALSAAPASAAFTASLNAPTSTSTFTPDGSAGAIVITPSGGLLTHNRFGDPGFNSSFDFDSSVAGDQTLATAGTSTVDVPDHSISVTVDDAAGSTGRTWLPDPSGTVVSGLVTVKAYPLTLNAGSGNDTLTVLNADNGFTLLADLGGGNDTATYISCPAAEDFTYSIAGGPGTDDLHIGLFGAATLTSGGLSSGCPAEPFTHSGFESYAITGGSFSLRNSVTGGERVDVTGSADNEVVRMSNGTSTSGGTIALGDGTDTLDYGAISGVSRFTTPVSVDLAGGTATGTAGISGVDIAGGGDASDTLRGDGGPNTLTGGGGADTLDGRAGADTLNTFDGGADVVDGGADADTLLAAGEDALAFSPGAGARTSVVRTDSGIDTTLDVGTVELFTVGTPAVDLTLDLVGVTSIQNFATPSSLVMRTSNADETWTVNSNSVQRTTGGAFNYQATVGSLIAMDLDFRGGNDTATMTGGGVSRTLRGGSGADTLTGFSTAETLEGGPGADVLDGAGGADTLRGDGEDDTLKGGAGNDSLDGGAGVDTADFSDATTAIDFDVAAGQATANGIDTLTAIEGAIGGPFGDHFTGDAGPNRFVGGGGGDKLEGNGGADQLDGGNGNDELYGGAGADTANGGAGDDFLRLRDGAAVDTAACGADLDRVEVDAGEGAGGDCELVEAPSGPGSQGPPGSNGANGSNGSAGAQGQTGATGAAGATGATGPQGPRGATGPAGRDAKVTCTVPKPSKGQVKVTCKVTLTAKPASSVRARLERGGRTYAAGAPVRRNGRLSLRFDATKRLRPGRYTLVVDERTAAGRTITRLTVTL